MNEYKLEHICSYTGQVATPPEVIGPLPEGIRVNFYLTGGEIVGPNFRGTFRAVGGDWVSLRKDGVAYLDTQATIETHDGALILVTYPGAADFGEDGYEKFLRGEMPPILRLRTSPRFVTSHPEYLWLNRIFCIGIGEYHAVDNKAKYDVYAVL
jgi:hypothetical protein